MEVKRWILMLFMGIVFTSLACAMGIAWIYRNYAFPEWSAGFVQAATLQFIPHPYREILVIAPGVIFVVYGVFRLSHSLTGPLMEQRGDTLSLAKIIESYRLGDAEPPLKIVTIGGGTGLSTLLRGLKYHNVSITAIVTAGDDGGSSGRLRTEFNVPAPGDIRNCLVALADSETLLGELFQYRFDAADPGLNGHSFGNLFITALTKVSGSFEQAIIESGKVLKIRGAVMPSSAENMVVCAEMADGTLLRGETTIVESRVNIKRVFLDPESAEAYEPAIAALLSADLVVLGPGSLYTSVIPNILVEGIQHALRFTPAPKVYVCNVATQPGETDGFQVVDHVRALVDHFGGLPFDRVLVNSNLEPSRAGIKPEWGVSAVSLTGLGEFERRVVIDSRDVVNPEFPLRHDPEKLAAALVDIAQSARAAGPRPAQSWWSPARGRTNGRLAPATVAGAAQAASVASRSAQGRRES